MKTNSGNSAESAHICDSVAQPPHAWAGALWVGTVPPNTDLAENTK
eukprot:COSAG05_NODE_7818_length_766_cov_1.535232_1_plen_45_part_01